MKALVTGVAGFIGSHLAEGLLKLGWGVKGIDSFTDYYSRKIKEDNLRNLKGDKGFSFQEGDLLELNLKKDLEEIDYLFHLAAQPGVRKSWGKNFEYYIRNNITVTQRLLEKAKGLPLKKVVLASSSSVYGESPLPMKEDNVLRPISPYGVTKLASEKLGYLYYRSYKAPVIILRYFTVYGSRQRPDMALHRFIKAILNNEEITIYGDGNQTRDFTYVSDTVEATIKAAQCEAGGEIINIGGGAQVTVNETLKILEEITKKKAKVRYIEKQKGDMLHTFADISKAKRLLDYQPKVKLREGLKKEVAWLATTKTQNST
ncbi:GDP-mannose 4,6-dehydratase [bacterium]|nr:GDP-mannose 4,6-dehydratase [bacterium]MBU4561761.1 GDP-mannose 4,6-dehydratase [bacterium]MCG2676575.1 GDP-mannose 4,6-dehydratase [bacterium]MCG2677433.1 GDP-mannose 4,6-dehydratase [bacterium]